MRDRVSRVSQQSGVSTVPAASNELRAFRRGVPGSEMTMVDLSGGSHSSVNRFSALSDPSSVEFEARGDARRRRLVLISQQQEREEADHEWDLDTDSVGGVSEGEVADVVGLASAEPIDVEARVRAPMRSFASLDVLNFSELFESRPRVMGSVPHILRGGFRLALRVAFQEILAGVEANSEARSVRGLKLLLVLPRMLLFRPSAWRHGSSKEVGGEAEAVSGRCPRSLVGANVESSPHAAKLRRVRAWPLAVSPH